jgi:hypothetical protein
MCRKIGEAGEVTDLIHRYLARRFFAPCLFFTVFNRCQRIGLDETEIGVAVLLEPMAGIAFLAGRSICMWRFAQQRLGIIHRQIEFPYPLRPLQQ